MNITILGCGRWGAFLAWYSCRLGHNVFLWGRPGSSSLAGLKAGRQNEYLKLQDEITLGSSLERALDHADIVIIAIKAQELREFSGRIREYIPALQTGTHAVKAAANNAGSKKTFILCMKGIEASSGKRLSEVFAEETGNIYDIAVWLGPGHVQDFVREIPNCMVVDSLNVEISKKVADNLGSDLIRFYYGRDLVGNEVGAASKNVVGIAAGMLDGMNYTGLKGALMARGAREISRLVKAMGGNELTVYGLSHLGDYEATLFSPYSHNRRLGEEYVKGHTFAKLAEGATTVKALKHLSVKYNVELPISNAVHSILFEGRAPGDALLSLFLRSIKFEF